jgi:hypothetical protein
MEPCKIFVGTLIGFIITILLVILKVPDIFDIEVLIGETIQNQTQSGSQAYQIIGQNIVTLKFISWSFLIAEIIVMIITGYVCFKQSYE